MRSPRRSASRLWCRRRWGRFSVSKAAGACLPRDPCLRLRYDARRRRFCPVNQIPGANSLRNGPDGRGRFGEFGGRFVAETLMPLILEVEQAYLAARADPAFQTELD